MYQIKKILPILLYFAVTKCEELSCYQCAPTRDHDIGLLPCSDFNWGWEYITKCPKSTLCFKRTYTIPLGDGNEIKSVERGCAPQKQEVQKYDRSRKKWQKTEEIIEDIYEEGCFMGEDIGRPGRPTEYCYCSSWWCNKSSSFREISFPLIVLQLTVILFSL